MPGQTWSPMKMIPAEVMWVCGHRWLPRLSPVACRVVKRLHGRKSRRRRKAEVKALPVFPGGGSNHVNVNVTSPVLPPTEVSHWFS